MTYVVMVGYLEDSFFLALLHEAGLRGPVEEQQQVLLGVTHLVILETFIFNKYKKVNCCIM